MMETNYPKKKDGGDDDATTSTTLTPLTKMLMMAAPTEGGGMPEGYEANYKAAYRRCQDKPGGGYKNEYISEL